MTDIAEGALPDRCPTCGYAARQMFPIGTEWALWCRNEHRWLVPGLVALMRRVLLVLLLWSVFWAGRMVEQRSQLGKMLVLAPALADLDAATKAADSIGMGMLIRMGQRPVRSIPEPRRQR